MSTTSGRSRLRTVSVRKKKKIAPQQGPDEVSVAKVGDVDLLGVKMLCLIVTACAVRLPGEKPFFHLSSLRSLSESGRILRRRQDSSLKPSGISSPYT